MDSSLAAAVFVVTHLTSALGREGGPNLWVEWKRQPAWSHASQDGPSSSSSTNWGRVLENGTFLPSCRESQLKLNYCIYVPPLRMIVSLKYNQVKRSCSNKPPPIRGYPPPPLRSRRGISVNNRRPLHGLIEDKLGRVCLDKSRGSERLRRPIL